MATDVQVTDDGMLAITCDAGALPPLPVDVIEAACARLDDARNAAARQTLTAAVRTLTDVLLTQGDTMAATVNVSPAGLNAVVDPGSYEAMRTQLALTPDDDGALVWGPASVTAAPPSEPEPEPDPEPAPEPDPAPTPDPEQPA